MFDYWESNQHLYVLMEYCENGTLDVFLQDHGRVRRLDEWRVWKILVELALGLRFIHDSGYVHLDMKPANVLITFEGTLKISDFGMAAKLPITGDMEDREGDREYIAPEVLSKQQYGKPADIFSLGLMMLETAANIVLPDNGLHWQKLRSGDLSGAGRLSSGEIHSGTKGNSRMRTIDGLSAQASDPDFQNSMDSLGSATAPTDSLDSGSPTDDVAAPPSWYPRFMSEEGSLDELVKWMTVPLPENRATIHDIVNSESVRWVDRARKAGAVVYEGDYGPGPDDPMVVDENWRFEL
ncbi:hypothetical protein CANCADRAFT_26922 [Tortispora caseinolytica NRRL Y-17796]|uniref:Protein kinase domain-containing protein n=1 Tax=Tortispora caseinolytica NRRL Y-17796 TaxID=767744 RepID=A0A1E4TA37_9ASCO|nr:hypothetical protein CANCADRAFT_26922 [Tortispora caseinolytica NRRL Y-17796]